jgi:hypothetical protein
MKIQLAIVNLLNATVRYDVSSAEAVIGATDLHGIVFMRGRPDHSAGAGREVSLP